MFYFSDCAVPETGFKPVLLELAETNFFHFIPLPLYLRNIYKWLQSAREG